MDTQPLQSLFIPALKSHMGDWNYYVAFLRFEDVAARVSIAEEIHSAKSLRDLLQRGLKDRAAEIAEYLLTQPQRFFNALVVGTYGGHPNWRELEVRASIVTKSQVPQYAEGSLGFLELSGEEVLFAIDGQHRVAGIREAIRLDPKMKREEVAVIFLKGVTQRFRSKDQSGFERTRRLFTTLNSRAKPVGKRDIIALDEDDVVAITTRTMVEENMLFVDKVYAKGSKSIAASNKTALTTIIALYDALDEYLRLEVRKLPSRKQRRPNENAIKQIRAVTDDLYSELQKAFPALAELAKSNAEDEVAAKYRDRNGGHVLFRPVGFLVVHRVIARLLETGSTMKDAVKRIGKVPMDLTDRPWLGLLWDNVNRRMITNVENQKVAERIVFNAVGGDLAFYKTTPQVLRTQWAGLLNKTPGQLRLPTYS